MKWKALLFDNLLLKAISIVLAILLWHQVAQQQTAWQIISIPIGFKMPDGMMITNDHPNLIEVLARSQRSVGVDRTQLTAVIDLPETTPGTQVVQLTERNINRPAHVEIDSITPAMIRLEIEGVVSKTIRVQPQYRGEPAAGFEVTAIRVLPNEIRVSGPASRVTGTEAIRTIPIDIADQRQSITRNAFVDLEDRDLRIDDNLSLVVNIVIEEKRREIRVQGVVVSSIPADVPARLESSKLDLVGTIPLSWEDDLDPELFIVQIDLSAAEPSSRYSEFEPQITIPLEYVNIFRLMGTRPEKVRARRRQ